MDSPGSYGSSYGSSLGTGSLGAQHARVQVTMETIVDRNWNFDQGQHKSKCGKDAAEFLEQIVRTLAKVAREGDGLGCVLGFLLRGLTAHGALIPC